MIKLYVAGYPFDIEEVELLEIFCFYGTVHSISLIREKATGKHKGYGFIEMIDQEGAERVIEAVNGLSIRGRVLTVKIADAPKDQSFRSSKPKYPKARRHSKPYGKVG